MPEIEFLTIPHLSRKRIAQIFSKIEIDPVTGCWNWTGCRTTKNYGKTNYKSEVVPAHRLMYAWLVEPLPRGIGKGIPVLDHFVCDNPPCCNPAHLRLGSQRDNVLRGAGPCAQNARKTHCKRGHELPDTGNERRCRTCHDMKAAEYYRKNREAVIARTNRSRQVRENGPRREELLAKKRERYHRTKKLKRHSV
jgi:hypothetical protein